ncbi:hypothetical protein ACHAWO_008085 [Cyclotella atomus]|uniref:Uncharacterized protein n=1 Tax=Cyclotella atomus TaxID=382360 RepID=A0ABD3NS15_9STRA
MVSSLFRSSNLLLPSSSKRTSKAMADWLSRKRPATSAVATVNAAPNKSVSFSDLPLDWTKLTSCHIKKRKPNIDINKASLVGTKREELQRVKGKGIFFLHDANSDLRDIGESDINNSDGEGSEENLIWFQGRFFPSTLEASSPTSITSSFSTNFVSKSWGLLGVQKHVQDECLRCSEGGYRELDLTFIRHINTGIGARKKAIRWNATDLTWTGGDMMRLSSDYALRDSETGVKFEPTTMIDGDKALDIGRKYFSKLMNQLSSDKSSEEYELDTLVVIGSMEAVLPVDFVRRGAGCNLKNDEEDNDGLWSD